LISWTPLIDRRINVLKYLYRRKEKKNSRRRIKRITHKKESNNKSLTRLFNQGLLNSQSVNNIPFTRESILKPMSQKLIPQIMENYDSM
jgi:hypothetical protein